MGRADVVGLSLTREVEGFVVVDISRESVSVVAQSTSKEEQNSLPRHEVNLEVIYVRSNVGAPSRSSESSLLHTEQGGGKRRDALFLENLAGGNAFPS